MNAKHFTVYLSSAAVVVASLAAGTALADALGGFLIYADNFEFGVTDRSLVVYDPADPSTYLFSMYMGTEGPADPNDISDWTFDATRGDIYVYGFDSGGLGAVGFVSTPGTPWPNDTDADQDLYRIDFDLAVDTWVANGKAQIDFYPRQIDIDFPADHANPSLLNGMLTKIGEVQRPVNISGGHITEGGEPFFGSRIAFRDPDTMIVLENSVIDSVGASDDKKNDHTIRLLKRVSTGPGVATFSTNGPPQSRHIIGGGNAGATESWESIVIGKLNMEASGFSDPQDIAYYKDPVTGIEGIWIFDSDLTSEDPTSGEGGTGDDVGFFQITNFSGTFGNGLRTITGIGDTFAFADDPETSDATDDGHIDWVQVDPLTGALYIGSGAEPSTVGFPGTTPHEPRVSKVTITDYDAGAGTITLGSWTTDTYVITGGDDDDTNFSDGRHGVVDYVNNVAYIFENEEGGLSAQDVYKLDLATGVTTLVTLDIAFHAEFPNGRWLDFIFRPLGGDFNFDGTVSFADFGVLQANFGQIGTLASGDANGDMLVSFADFGVLQANFGTSGSTLGPGQVGVPEPATLALLLGLGGLMVLRRRRRG